MHETAFADSVIQAPVKVLGLWLRPFSIGHHILLQRQRNALMYVTGRQFALFSAEGQYRAIEDAVWICAHTWKENRDLNASTDKFWRWRAKRMDHGMAIEAFLHYRIAGSSGPPSPTEDALSVLGGQDEGGRMLGAPFLSRLYNFIVTLPEREQALHGDSAFDFPLGFATFLYMAHLERDGSCKIENEKEAEIRKEFETHEAELAKERAAKAVGGAA